MCDSIAANLINRIQHNDKENSHAAIEVFASDDTIIFGGEAKTTLKLNKKFLKQVLKESFNDCGYTDDKRLRFSKEQVHLAKDTKIINKIHAQSPDIARATTDKKGESGWNDQGIFFSGFDSMTPTGQGAAKYLANSFGEYLFDMAKNCNYLGSDIKVVFTLNVKEDGYTPISVEHVTVAIPCAESYCGEIYSIVNKYYEDWTKTLLSEYGSSVYKLLRNTISAKIPSITVNGTGRYVNHGYHSDASMTGRKLAVNNMSAGPISSQCQCGGGSYIKPFHASDFLLPMVGTWISKAIVDMGLTPYASVALSCTIGSTVIDSICVMGDSKFNKNTKLRNNIVKGLVDYGISPAKLGKIWDFYNKYDFYKIEEANFVTNPLSTLECPWYKTEDLISYLSKYIKEVQ
jgi:S-adenosylmethionine synthetase